MRAALVVLSLLAAMLPTAAQAQRVFAEPADLIEYVYAPYLAGEYLENWEEVFSPTLAQLFADMEAKSQELGEPILDADPFINGQDYEISELLIADPAIEGDRAIVDVSFLNFGQPSDLRYTLVRRAEGWKIDDIESMRPGEEWRLSELLAFDPLLN
jgi:hypothetical protein